MALFIMRLFVFYVLFTHHVSVHHRAKELGEGSEAPTAHSAGHVSVPGRERSPGRAVRYTLPQHAAHLPTLAQ